MEQSVVSNDCQRKVILEIEILKSFSNQVCFTQIIKITKIIVYLCQHETKNRGSKRCRHQRRKWH